MASVSNIVREETGRPDIKGWGADLDPKNRPGVPHEAAPPDGGNLDRRPSEELERQVPRVKIFKTIERDSLTPVFGTACPPKGISGLLRAFAYRSFSESKTAHWMTLLLADRVDVVESFVREWLTGHPENPVSELGLGIELRERESLKRNLALGAGAAVVTGAVWLARRRKAA